MTVPAIKNELVQKLHCILVDEGYELKSCPNPNLLIYEDFEVEYYEFGEICFSLKNRGIIKTNFLPSRVIEENSLSQPLRWLNSWLHREEDKIQWDPGNQSLARLREFFVEEGFKLKEEVGPAHFIFRGFHLEQRHKSSIVVSVDHKGLPKICEFPAEISNQEDLRSILSWLRIWKVKR